MKQYTNEYILTQPIQDLPFSESFRLMATQNNWNTLEQLLSHHAAKLHSKKGFSMHLYDELIAFLKKQDLLEKLKQRTEV